MRSQVRRLLWVSLALSLLSPLSAFAYPEIARHGYTSCTSCHISPSGGGVLSAYGRSISQALVSMAGTESEAAPFYGVLPLPEQVQAQAFVKGLQFMRDNTRVREGQLFLMQTEVEAAATIGPVTAVASAAVDPDLINGNRQEGSSTVFSPDHYLLYRANDNIGVRAGRFLPDYGIKLANHSVSTRQGLGLAPGLETYNLEASYSGDSWSGAVTGIAGRPDDRGIQAEKGFALTGAAHIAEKHRIGASFLHGSTSSGDRRDVFGPNAVLGLTTKLYLLCELDWQRAQSNSFSGSRWGFMSYHRLAYEFIQGLQGYGVYQTRYTNLSDATSKRQAVGAGSLFYPRPHFELQFEVQKKISPVPDSDELFGFLVVGIYL